MDGTYQLLATASGWRSIWRQVADRSPISLLQRSSRYGQSLMTKQAPETLREGYDAKTDDPEHVD